MQFSPSFRHSHQGFSILMAIGTIGVLLIIVSSLAVTYVREMRLSRTSYDEVVAYANAEGMFEYAMLKVRNHREGFSDSVDGDEIDGKVLLPTTARSRGVQGSYTIDSSSTGHTFSLEPNNHLILPLFVGDGTIIGVKSKDPNPDSTIKKTQDLSVTLGDLSWTIVAMSGSESIGLTGKGDISPTMQGTIRQTSSQCYSHIDGAEISCDRADIGAGDERLEYAHDTTIPVAKFLENVSDPYFMVFNDSALIRDINVTSTTPFTLPTLTITAQAQKNDSLQVFQFSEDKSKYYDALKYGIYNSTP